jgi:hypothetical protein
LIELGELRIAANRLLDRPVSLAQSKEGEISFCACAAGKEASIAATVAVATDLAMPSLAPTMGRMCGLMMRRIAGSWTKGY